ncbi:hypothetical protein HK101_005842, partial [Irineochytrium annulatum]
MRFPAEILHQIFSCLLLDGASALPHPQRNASLCQSSFVTEQSHHSSGTTGVDKVTLIQCAWNHVTLGNKCHNDKRALDVLISLPRKDNIRERDLVVLRPSHQYPYQQHQQPSPRTSRRNLSLTPPREHVRHISVKFDVENQLMTAGARGIIAMGAWSFWVHEFIKIVGQGLKSLKLEIEWSNRNEEEQDWGVDVDEGVIGYGRSFVRGFMLDCAKWIGSVSTATTFTFDARRCTLAHMNLADLIGGSNFTNIRTLELSFPKRKSLHSPTATVQRLARHLSHFRDSFATLRSLILRNISVIPADESTQQPQPSPPIQEPPEPLADILAAATSLTHIELDRCLGLITPTALDRILPDFHHAHTLRALIIRDCQLARLSSTNPNCQSLHRLLTRVAGCVNRLEISDNAFVELNIDTPTPATITHLPWPQLIASALLPALGLTVNAALRTLQLSHLPQLTHVPALRHGSLPSLESLALGPALGGMSATVIETVRLACCDIRGTTRLRAIGVSVDPPARGHVSGGLQLVGTTYTLHVVQPNAAGASSGLDTEDRDSVQGDTDALNRRRELEHAVTRLIRSSPACERLVLGVDASDTLVNFVSTAATRSNSRLRDVILERCDAVDRVESVMRLMASLCVERVQGQNKGYLGRPGARVKMARLSDY